MAYNPFREGAINAMAPFAGGYEAMLALDALLDYLEGQEGEWWFEAQKHGNLAPFNLITALRGESDQ